MNRARRTVAGAASSYSHHVATDRLSKLSQVPDVVVVRLNGNTRAKKELNKYIGAMNFRLVGMRMMRRALCVVVTWNAAFVVMLRVGTSAKIPAPFECPNRAGVKYCQAGQDENEALHANCI